MKATFVADAWDGSKSNPVQAKWPECFTLHAGAGGIERCELYGIRDYGSCRLCVWYVVSPGVYEIREADRHGFKSRYLRVEPDGQCSNIEADEVAKSLSEI